MKEILRPAKISILLFILISPASFATKYYIDSVNGSNSNNGYTSETAWKTLSKIGTSTFSSGDSILLKRGGVWRETLTIPSSGTSTGFIYLGGYGNGIKPRILGSNLTTWTNQVGNVWVSDQTFINPYSGGRTSEIFFINLDRTTSWGVHKASSAGLTSEFDWTWESERILVYSATDPDDRYESVEIPQRTPLIEPNNKQNIHFDGLDLFYSVSEGIGDGSYPNLNLSGLIIENCHIAYLGSREAEVGYGTTAVYSDMILRNDTIHDCGRRSISINLYASGFTVKNILIEGNVLYNGSHTTGVDMSIGTGLFTGSLDDITIRKNLIYEDPHSKFTSELIFAQNYNKGGTFTNLFIYNNIFKYPTISAIKLEHVQSAFIFNNTFYCHNLDRIGNTYDIFIDNGSTGIKIMNNIFYTSLGNDTGGSGLSVYVSSSQDTRQIDVDYNLYYRLNDNLRIIIANGKDFYLNSLPSLNTQFGWEMHSPPPSDPLFYSDDDFHLHEGSPAIGKGVRLLKLLTDFYGKNYNDPPSIGAVEGNPSSLSIPGTIVFILYPNPSTGAVNIFRSGSNLDVLDYRVFSLSGKLLREGTLEREEATLNLHLDSGVYIIRITNGDNTTAAQKLVFVD